MLTYVEATSVPIRDQYIANGTNKVFDFSFILFEKTDLKVYLDDILQNSTTYTITFKKGEKGGLVTFKTAPANGKTVTLLRDLKIMRTTDFQEGGILRANILNYELDYQIACQQQIADALNRSLALPPYVNGTELNLTLPIPEAGKSIVWSSDGKHLENSLVEINEISDELDTKVAEVREKSAAALQACTIAEDKANTATEAAALAQAATATKASQDMDNLSSAGKKNTAILSFPSTAYVDIPLPASNTTYTAPANGFFVVDKTSGTQNAVAFYVINQTTNLRAGDTSISNSYARALLFMPVRKDDILFFDYNYEGATNICRFIYAQGEL